MGMMKRKRGTIYDWLDTMIFIILAFFVMLFLFYSTASAKSVTDNIIKEKADDATARQDLINFLRLRVSDVVQETQTFPPESRNMTFAQFFSWWEFRKHTRPGLSDDNIEKLNKGIASVFGPEYGKWELQVVQDDNNVIYRYGNQPVYPKVTVDYLPTYAGNTLMAVLYTPGSEK